MPDEIFDNVKQTLTPEAEKLLDIYSKEEKEVIGTDLEKIKISHTIGHVTFWYEKLRNAVDYQEEHLLRKNAIRRIIARKFNIPIPSTDKMSNSLLRELVRARYIDQTEFYPETIEKIDQVINKYAILRKDIFSTLSNKDVVRDNRILLDIISCEIEELLVNHDKEEALAGCMVSVMKRRFKTEENEDSSLKDLHIYIAVHRALLKSDQGTIRYQIFKRRFPHWFNLEHKDEIISGYERFLQMNKEIDEYLFNPMVDKVQKIIRKKTAPFYILGETLKTKIKFAKTSLTDTKTLTNLVDSVCQEHYSNTGSKLRRSVVQGITYIFFTKMVLGLIFELPYDLLTLGRIHTLPLAINLIFPPSFMFVITSGVKVPGWHNTEKIIAEIKSIIYEKAKEEDDRVYLLNHDVRRTKTKTVMLTLLYLLAFALTFGIIFWILNLLNFNIVSGILFFFFLSVVSFFGFRIRQNARSLFVMEEKEGVGSIVGDFLFMPFLRIGRWLAMKFQGLNIFLIILDFIIEAPFKSVMEVVEDWVAFMKEKKEELT